MMLSSNLLARNFLSKTAFWHMEPFKYTTIQGQCSNSIFCHGVPATYASTILARVHFCSIITYPSIHFRVEVSYEKSVNNTGKTEIPYQNNVIGMHNTIESNIAKTWAKLLHSDVDMEIKLEEMLLVALLWAGKDKCCATVSFLAHREQISKHCPIQNQTMQLFGISNVKTSPRKLFSTLHIVYTTVQLS